MAASSPAVRRVTLMEQSRALADLLSQLPATRDIEDAWTAYDDAVREIQVHDRRSVSVFESEVDGLIQVPGSRPFPIRAPALLSERLADDLRDAWARLVARDIVHLLKRETDQSLRGIADMVGVSTAYLSQLANGTGPVPSYRILEKLRAGLRKVHANAPERPTPPDDAVAGLMDRALRARNNLSRLSQQRPRPQVQIDGLPPREIRRLVPLFEGLAERCADGHEKSVIFRLLEALAAADDDLQQALIALTDNEDIKSLILHLSALDEKARKGLLAFLRAGASQRKVVPTGEPKETKRERVRRQIND